MISVTFPAGVYSLESIKRAAYRFSGKMAVDIRPGEKVIECVLMPLPDVSGTEVDSLAIRFRNEVLDQDLRATIAEETEAQRNAILAYAFSQTGLQG